MFLLKQLLNYNPILFNCRQFNPNILYISTIDRSLVPKLDESELEEQFVRGSGPGGQSVNKTSNCVLLKHKPSGLLVKCHTSRKMQENRKEARRLMVIKLDNLINGESSVENQEKILQKKKLIEGTRRRKKVEEMKQKWREREHESECDK